MVHLLYSKTVSLADNHSEYERRGDNRYWNLTNAGLRLSSTKGLPAMQYLSRYGCRGMQSGKAIIKIDNT